MFGDLFIGVDGVVVCWFCACMYVSVHAYMHVSVCVCDVDSVAVLSSEPGL